MGSLEMYRFHRDQGVQTDQAEREDGEQREVEDEDEDEECTHTIENQDI
jgi:hypothetical protein